VCVNTLVNRARNQGRNDVINYVSRLVHSPTSLDVDRKNGLIEHLAFVRRGIIRAELVHRVGGGNTFVDEAVGDDEGEVDDALGVTPFVVIPRDNLDHVIAHHHGESRVNGGGHVGAPEIDRHERDIGDRKNTLHRAILRFLERGVDFFSGDALLLNVDDEVDDGHVRRRHAKRDTLSLPLSCGKTSATALAAPVEVGTMFKAAARARRKSR